MARSALVPAMPVVSAPDRRAELLAAAARRFARVGFEATSMRDIAGDVGMLAGSIYHHFPAKDAMIAAIYALGVAQIEAAVAAALDGASDPWERLEALAVAHLEALLAESPFAAVLTADLARLSPGLRRKLVVLRDRYEARFAAVLEAVPLPRDIDRHLLRLHLLGALNATPAWYRPDGGRTPRAIALAHVRVLRRGSA